MNVIASERSIGLRKYSTKPLVRRFTAGLGAPTIAVGYRLVSCEYRGILSATPQPSVAFCLDVARMSRAYSNSLLDQYEQDVDEIVAACNGDLRGAVKALMLVNEQLEQRLWLMSAELVERLPDHRVLKSMH